jgi:ferrous iron transport protein A
VSHGTLASLGPGTRAVVRAIRAERDFTTRLLDLGFVPGTVVRVVRHAPLGDPMELVVRGAHFSIRLSEAEHVHVEVL